MDATLGRIWRKFSSNLLRKARFSSPQKSTRLVFVFSPRGSHWKGMGKQLYKESLIFRETIRRCDLVIKEMMGWSLVSRYEEGSSGEEFRSFTEEEFFEPEVVALQLALTEVWRRHGVLPDAVTGLSGGEFAAAHAAGALTLRDTMKLACAVSLMIRQRRGLGKMVVMQYDSRQISTLIEKSNQPVFITALHSNITSIVSGSNEAIEKFIAFLESNNIIYHLIPSDFAFHSPLVDEWKAPFLKLIGDIHPLYTPVAIYSSSCKRKLAAKVELEHWWDVVRKTALFNEAIETMLEQEYDTFIEISPHPLLTDAVMHVAAELGKKVNVYPTIRRDEDEIGTINSTLKFLKEIGYKPAPIVQPGNGKTKIRKRQLDLRSLVKISNEKKYSKYGFLSEKIRINPYAYYDHLRNSAPVHFFIDQGFWTVSRYSDAVYILKSPSQFSSEPMAKFDPSLLGANPPDHTRVRRIVSQLFSNQYLNDLKEYIRTLTNELITAAIHKKNWDIIDELATPLPLKVIMTMLGANHKYEEDFMRWSHSAVISATGVIDDADRPAIEKDKADCLAFLNNHIKNCRKNPNSSAFSALLEDKNGLTDNEAINFAQLLLIAGNETTTNLIGNTFLVLLKYPYLIDEIRNNKELIPSLVEEVLRYDTPVQFVQRIAIEDIVLSGVPIPRGARILVLIGSANRDPLHFNDADKFILNRNSKDHLAFGTGVHFCLGAQLARMQTIIVLQQLIEQQPYFRITESLQEIERVNSVQLRGPRHIWVTH